MRTSKKIFAALFRQNSSSNTTQQTQYNCSTEQNMATLLEEKTVKNVQHITFKIANSKPIVRCVVSS
jgi:hypothetical protein